MPLQHDKPFYRTKTDEEKSKEKGKSFTVWMSEEEYAELQQLKIQLQQPKDSTALKQLSSLGANLIGDHSTQQLLRIIFKNKRNNDRIGQPIDKAPYEQN